MLITTGKAIRNGHIRLHGESKYDVSMKKVVEADFSRIVRDCFTAMTKVHIFFLILSKVINVGECSIEKFK